MTVNVTEASTLHRRKVGRSIEDSMSGCWHTLDWLRMFQLYSLAARLDGAALLMR